MHNLLTKIFAKRGIKDFNELDNTPLPDGSPSERQVFETWNKILSEGEMTVEKIQEFCQSQIDVIENKWKDLDIEQTKKAEWIPIHNVYSAILLAIKSPKAARENLEKQLIELTK
uniref:Uncharacterized protein n=1 Tax=viral metagenome TaxID=1070528 RepID=A0A6M3JTV3_9ZZZZ